METVEKEKTSVGVLAIGIGVFVGGMCSATAAAGVYRLASEDQELATRPVRDKHTVMSVGVVSGVTAALLATLTLSAVLNPKEVKE